MPRCVRIRFGLLVPLAVLLGCSGGGDSRTSSSGAGGGAPLCPNGIAAADPMAFGVFDCPDADPTNDACCTESPVYCAVLDCDPTSSCNVFRKTLYACQGETWAGKQVLKRCDAATGADLEALDGKPCSNEAPCDITTGDLDERIAICKDGVWKVFSSYPKR